MVFAYILILNLPTNCNPFVKDWKSQYPI